MDTIFDSETIRAIQTDELSSIQELSIVEISNRIDAYQKASRELMLRMNKASEEMHRRLSQKTNDELETLIERVPEGVSSTAYNRLHNTLLNRKGYVPKARAPKIEDRLVTKLNAAAKSNPAIQAMLDAFKAKD
jgi:hypothetical protein